MTRWLSHTARCMVGAFFLEAACFCYCFQLLRSFNSEVEYSFVGKLGLQQIRLQTRKGIVLLLFIINNNK